MTTEKQSILVIDLNPREMSCHRCGKSTPVKWGLPVSAVTGAYVPNWYEGDWAGAPACESCYQEHAVKSETTDPNRKTIDSQKPRPDCGESVQ